MCTGQFENGFSKLPGDQPQFVTDLQYSNEFVFVSVFFLWLNVQVERGSKVVNVMNVTDTIASTSR